MIPQHRKRNGPVPVCREEPPIEWKEYPRIVPGEYPAYCRFAKKYWDPAYRRWTCLLRWDVLNNDLLSVVATVPCWLSLGNREKPWASRRGRYLSEWVKANNGPPIRWDRLSEEVFVRRMARIEVGDTDSRRSPIPYSVVRNILSWETGGVHGSISQPVTQSRKAQDKRRRMSAMQRSADKQAQAPKRPSFRIGKGSALAGVEVINPTTHQGRAASGCPQRHV